MKRVSGLKVGDPRDPKTDIGPLMNKAQAETLSKQIQKGVDEGARVALRGKVEGTMASPTVFADVTPGMSVAQCEMFGPAVSVIPFDTPEEAIRIANDSAFGLSGAIHTKDVEYGAELAKQIDSGAIHVNDGTINDRTAGALRRRKSFRHRPAERQMGSRGIHHVEVDFGAAHGKALPVRTSSLSC